MFNFDRRKEELKLNAQVLQEILWSQVYRDSIRGVEPLEALSLNVGRWAVGYPFLYVLRRILKDFEIASVLELGLGESTKFVSTYMEHFLPNCKHHIIEHDKDWLDRFTANASLGKGSSIRLLPLIEHTVKNKITVGYSDLSVAVNDKYDLYIVDGPCGTDHYSRYDIIRLISGQKTIDNIIVLFDDADRQGEKETIRDFISLLRSRKINYYIGQYKGMKEVKVIATERYKAVTRF